MKTVFRMNFNGSQNIDKETVKRFIAFNGEKELQNAGCYPLAWTEDGKLKIQDCAVNELVNMLEVA